MNAKAATMEKKSSREKKEEKQKAKKEAAEKAAKEKQQMQKQQEQLLQTNKGGADRAMGRRGGADGGRWSFSRYF